jgi:hypothetical protein
VAPFVEIFPNKTGRSFDALPSGYSVCISATLATLCGRFGEGEAGLHLVFSETFFSESKWNNGVPVPLWISILRFVVNKALHRIEWLLTDLLS